MRTCAKGEYRGRRPKQSPLWQVFDRHFDEFLKVYDERYAPTYGPLRDAIPRVVGRFLKCGILDYGLARIRCPECHDEWLLGFSCRGKCLCPSCGKKRQLEFGELLEGRILESVPHRHVVLSVPRRLRPFFMRHRERLSKLTRAGYETIKELLQAAVGNTDSVPGAVVCTQTYGNLLDGHPHLHMLVSWGLFDRVGGFLRAAAVPDEETIEKLFRAKVLALLRDEGAIDDKLIANLLSWKHTGFSAHVGNELSGTDRVALEAVAQYLVHPPVVLGRILSEGTAGQVLYQADERHPRHKGNFRVFDPLDFIAPVVCHIPDAHEKGRIFYGFYSARARGWRRAQGLPMGPSGGSAASAACEAADSDQAPLEVRSRWAALIKKVWEVDPLVCRRCGAKRKIVAFIEDDKVITRILSHLELLSPGDDSRGPPCEASPATDGDGSVPSEFAWDEVADERTWEDSAVAGETGGEGFEDGGCTEEGFFDREPVGDE